MPGGLARAVGLAGLVVHKFLHLNFYIWVARIYLHLLEPFLCVWGGRNGWMDLDDVPILACT